MKLVILVRNDLKLPKGKLAAQVAHAAVECALKSDKNRLKRWRDEGAAKIVLKVKDEDELIRYMQIAKKSHLTTAFITDAGKTVIAPGTATCVGIGPDDDKKIDSITGNLKLL